MNPQDTWNLLDELESLGFDDSAFALLHHFRERGESHAIAAHRRYCEKTAEFRADLNNERTQRRLELVLRVYKGAGFRSHSHAVFRGLAEAAFAEIPTWQQAVVPAVGLE
jgi:lipopolysaccharide biosynthesis regulator YciM